MILKMREENFTIYKDAGDLVIEKIKIEKMIRVNHAGEYGAVRIYKAQYKILKNLFFQEMQLQEEEHLKNFQKIMVLNKIRPSLFLPVWHIGGFGLGAFSALCGENYAHACTIAVEEEIEKHYEKQLKELPSGCEALRELIAKHQKEECDHKEKAIAKGGKNILCFAFFKKSISCITKIAIRISEKI
jgi:ubiquinone biosynthesis monooxygenase Coq7